MKIPCFENSRLIFVAYFLSNSIDKLFFAIVIAMQNLQKLKHNIDCRQLPI